MAERFAVDAAAGAKNSAANFNDLVANQVIVDMGTVTITPSAANTPTEYPVTFNKVFPAIPAVLMEAATGSPEVVALSTKPSSRTTTGVILVLTRTNTVATSVTWVAVLSQ